MSQETASYINQLSELFEAGGQDSAFQQRLYDFLPSIIYIYDADKKKLRYINKKVTDVLGFSYDDLNALENDFTKVVFKEDLDSVLKELEKYNELKDDDSHAYKCRFNCKEGSWRHFHVTGKVLKRGENGKASSLLFVAQDVTERIQSSEEAKSLRELLRETEDMLRFGTWTWNVKTGSMKWSKGIYSLLGYEEKDVQETNTDFYMHHIVEEDVQNFKDAVDTALQNKEHFEKEYSIITAKGEEKIVYSRGKVILDEQNEVLKILGITRCVTEHSQLYKSLSNYKQMALEKEEFLGHGSWEMNYPDGTMLWSDGMYRLFGYNLAQDKGQLIIDEKLYRSHMSDEDFNAGKKSQDSLTHDDNYMWEYEILTKSGDRKKLETYGKFIRDRKGKVVQVIGTTRDITQLRNYERELEKKIIELKQSNKDLEDFAYIASHDIQEPLRKIISFSERLKTKYSQSLEVEAKNYLDRIMAATKNARLLVDGLMDFSRLRDEGQSFEKTDLNLLLQDIKTELELKVEETKTTILSENLPTLEAVPVQIKQLLINLILNAIKFKQKDVAPVIEIKSKSLNRLDMINYHLNPAHAYYKITIADNGIGFEEEYAEKIFQMFQRLHSKTDYPGAGIGLALCKKIAETHNGAIFANSKLGIGTTFSVILPEIQY